MDMEPYLKYIGKSPVPRTILWQHETCSAIRRGDWKLVTANDRDKNVWELYNLSEDRSETENLAEKHPDLAQELNKQWTEWATKTNVLPYPEERDNMVPTPWPPPLGPINNRNM
jgi:arylsulfatase A-like enzyme